VRGTLGASAFGEHWLAAFAEASVLGVNIYFLISIYFRFSQSQTNCFFNHFTKRKSQPHAFI
jgi:hypothetical protein